MNRTIKSLIILSFTSFSGLAQDAEGEYYVGPSADAFTASVMRNVDKTSTGSITNAVRTMTSRDNLLAGDHHSSGDYYKGVGPR